MSVTKAETNIKNKEMNKPSTKTKNAKIKTITIVRLAPRTLNNNNNNYYNYHY